MSKTNVWLFREWASRPGWIWRDWSTRATSYQSSSGDLPTRAWQWPWCKRRRYAYPVTILSTSLLLFCFYTYIVVCPSPLEGAFYMHTYTRLRVQDCVYKTACTYRYKTCAFYLIVFACLESGECASLVSAIISCTCFPLMANKARL